MKNKLWHGGVPGLRPGMWILPPSVTGIESCRTFEEAAELAPITRRDRVYLVDSEPFARAWAVFGALLRFQGRAWVYEVESPKLLEPDPDYIGDDECSFMAPCARVVRGYELSQSAIRRITAAQGYDAKLSHIRHMKMSRVLATYEARS